MVHVVYDKARIWSSHTLNCIQNMQF